MTAVALIAIAVDDRDDLSRHLRALGFAPRLCMSMTRAGTDRVVVCIRDRADAHLLAGLPAYCARACRHVVVVTRCPSLVLALAANHAAVLAVLVPPIVPRQLGDALHAASGVSS